MIVNELTCSKFKSHCNCLPPPPALTRAKLFLYLTPSHLRSSSIQNLPRVHLQMTVISGLFTCLHKRHSFLINSKRFCCISNQIFLTLDSEKQAQDLLEMGAKQLESIWTHKDNAFFSCMRNGSYSLVFKANFAGTIASVLLS